MVVCKQCPGPRSIKRGSPSMPKARTNSHWQLARSNVTAASISCSPDNPPHLKTCGFYGLWPIFNLFGVSLCQGRRSMPGGPPFIKVSGGGSPWGYFQVEETFKIGQLMTIIWPSGGWFGSPVSGLPKCVQKTAPSGPSFRRHKTDADHHCHGSVDGPPFSGGSKCVPKRSPPEGVSTQNRRASTFLSFPLIG